MPVNINDFDDALIGGCDDMLGDTISYKPAGGVWGDAQAFVDYREAVIGIGTGQAIDNDITVTLSKAQVPLKPGAGSRLKLPKAPGELFKPIAVRDMGDDWAFEVQRA